MAGTLSAGKSTVGRGVATVLDIAHIEIDGLFSWAGLDDPRSILCWLTSAQDRDRHAFANANAARPATVDQLLSGVTGEFPGQWR